MGTVAVFELEDNQLRFVYTRSVSMLLVRALAQASEDLDAERLRDLLVGHDLTPDEPTGCYLYGLMRKCELSIRGVICVSYDEAGMYYVFDT